MVPVPVGERLVEILASAPKAAAFGVPGGQTLPMYAAARRAGFPHVLMRDERNAACAADAFARLAGCAGVCDATVGPGVTNLVSGLAEAYASSIPVVAIVADIRTDKEHLRRRSVVSQAVDQRALLEAVTKWVARVGTADSLDEAFDQALRVATTGRPGPVAVEIPEDVFAASMADGAPRRPFASADFIFPRHRPAPAGGAVQAAVAALAGASRPLILAGGGVVATGGAPTLEAFAVRHGIPVVTSINGKGAIDETNPLSAGAVGLFGTARAAAALSAADAVLVVGSKLDQLTTHGWRLPRPGQVIVHVDVDGEEIGRAIPVEVSIVADARAAIEAIDERLAEMGMSGAASASSESWLGAIDDTAAGQAEAGPTDGVHPGRVVAAIDSALGPGDVLVCDASFASGWAAGHYRVKRAGPGLLAPRGLAGIGWAGGAAIGARLAAEPSSRVVVLAGDGGWAYSLAEMETATRLGLAITYVILNNSSLAWIRYGEDKIGAEPSSTFGEVDFAAVARAMGAEAAQAQTIDDVEAHLDKARVGGPYLIDVRTVTGVAPMVSLREASSLWRGR